MNIFEGVKSVPNLHPLFVHFPIALLITAGLLSVAFFFTEKEELALIGRWNLTLGAMFSVVTVITGLMAEKTLAHNDAIHEAMEIHEKIMIGMTLISLFLTAYLFVQKKPAVTAKRPLFIGGIVLIMVLLAIGADYGGKMVFKYGAGTELFIKVNPELAKGHTHSHEEGEKHNTDKDAKTDSGEQRSEHNQHDGHSHDH